MVVNAANLTEPPQSGVISLGGYHGILEDCGVNGGRPNLSHDNPGRIMAIRQAWIMESPETNPKVKVAMTVSPAPVTSKTFLAYQSVYGRFLLFFREKAHPLFSTGDQNRLAFKLVQQLPPD